MKKLLTNTVAEIFYYIPYLVILGLSLVLLYVGIKEGIFATYEAAFGKTFVVFGIITSTGVFLSIVWLRLLIGNRLIAAVSAYALTIIFFISALAVLNTATAKFSVFTKEDWTEFPKMRLVMYDNLVSQYNMVGYSESEIIALLGNPDEITENGVYVYDAGYGNEVYIIFGENGVKDYRYVE